ncbi:MAG TPA: hypothetical protein VFC53_09515 [Dehalococcoidia bacterium]|nr:hypothetical protein [Dehalococcoidia bacterium]
MDNDYAIDYDAILRTVARAEVISFRFLTVPDRLLIDNRFSEVDAPMMKLVPRVATAEERFRSLKALRPRFKLPKKISSIWWPRYIDALVEHGIWDAIVARIVANGYAQAEQECAALLAELRRIEREELHRAIAGEGYRTLWPAARA